MRLEYVVVGFILVMIVLLIAITMLKGVVPGVFDVIKLISGQ
jgi:hypothetical protein